MKRSIILFLFILLSFISFSQIGDRRLHIGDKMADVVLKDVANFRGSNIRLHELRGKIVILDFWSKGCTSCIQGMPFMQSMQKKYKDDIQIILVTKNTRKELESSFAKSGILKNVTLPMVFGDTVLSKTAFQYYAVPYHVWIDKQGYVKATVSAPFTTESNIKNLIYGAEPEFLVREDIIDTSVFKDIKDRTVSLLSLGDGRVPVRIKYFAPWPTALDKGKRENVGSAWKNISSSSYYSFFLDYLPGGLPPDLDGKLLKKDPTNEARPMGYRTCNASLFDLFKEAYMVSGDMKIVTDSSILELIEPRPSTNPGKIFWDQKHSFCYESSIPSYTPEKANELLRKDLLRVFGMIGSFETRELNEFEIRKINDIPELLWHSPKVLSEHYRTETGIVCTNCSFNDLINLIKAYNMGWLDGPVICDTGLSSSRNVTDFILPIKEFHLTKEALPDINSSLERYGLKCFPIKRNEKVFVIKKATIEF